MRQPSIKCIGEIIDLGGQIRGGLEALGAGLNLRVMTDDEFGAELEELITQQAAYQQAYEEWAKRSAAVKKAVQECRAFMRVTRDALKAGLGYQYSTLWNALGFMGTLMIPMTAAKVSPMLKIMCAYLDQHRGVEVAKLEVTYARALQVDAALDAAVQALASHDLAMANMLRERNRQAEKLRGLIRLLTAELRQVLGAVDSRWERFGLNQPGGKGRPAAPEGIDVQVVGGNKGAVKWPRVARAERYRIWMHEVGSTAEPQAIATVFDPDYLFELLPEVETEVWITALNSGGESRNSAVIRLGRGTVQ